MGDKIFISYRRSDRASDASNLALRLEQEFGAEKVFIDVDNLLPGENFPERLAQELDECDVLVAVIGPNWLSILNERTASVVAKSIERDYLREEIATALQRRLIVVPLLVDGAELPAEELLPDDLRLLRLHGEQPYSMTRPKHDAAVLANAIRTLRKRRDRKSSRFWLVAATSALLAAFVGILIWRNQTPSAPLPPLAVASRAQVRPPLTLEAQAAHAKRWQEVHAAKRSAEVQAYINEIAGRRWSDEHFDEATRLRDVLEDWENVLTQIGVSAETIIDRQNSGDKSRPLPVRNRQQAIQLLNSFRTEWGSRAVAAGSFVRDIADEWISELVDQEKVAACDDYGASAATQVKQARGITGCAVPRDLHWRDDESSHVGWCHSASPEARSTQTAARARVIDACTMERDAGFEFEVIAKRAKKSTDAIPESSPVDVARLRSEIDLLKAGGGGLGRISAAMAADEAFSRSASCAR